MEESELSTNEKGMTGKNGVPIFYFDDEPIENILYGPKPQGGSVANLFLPALECVERMSLLSKTKDVNGLIEAASELGEKGYPLTIRLIAKLTSMILPIVPNLPLAVLPYDLQPLGLLLRQMWTHIISAGDKDLITHLGGYYYRWNEHYGHYEEARSVLATRIEIARERNNHGDEAIYLNNFAFEYLLERRWEEAIPIFDRAADLFRGVKENAGWANSRANSWLCRFEIGDFGDESRTREEFITLRQSLKGGEGYQARKPLILQAKLEEQKGDLAAAIRLVRRAIDVGSDGKTRFPEIDAIYLKQLERKRRIGV